MQTSTNMEICLRLVVQLSKENGVVGLLPECWKNWRARYNAFPES